jgi:uncharacterized protein (UPF0332 family)
VTPGAKRFLDKARDLLVQAAVTLDASLNDAAGRIACLPGFHAAQAFVFEHTGQARKTHSGVKAEFPRLTKDSAERAAATIEAGKRFVNQIIKLLAIDCP